MRSDKAIILWLIPALAPIFLFTFYPIAYAVIISLYRYNLKYMSEVGFIGLGNYVEVLKSYYFISSIRSTIIFAVSAILLVILVSLGQSLVLSRGFRGSRLLEFIILVPWSTPLVVGGLMWKWIFDSDYGVFNDILLKMGVIQSYQSWLSNPSAAMIILIITYLWVQTPLPTLLLLAGLQSIPKHVYEASSLDGASTIERLRHITLPLLKPMLFVVIIYTTLMAIWTFDIIYVVTKGGPAETTSLISFYIYREMFGFLDFGRAAALSVMVLVVSLVLILLYFRALRMAAK